MSTNSIDASSDEAWTPFGVRPADYDEAPGRPGVRVLNLTMRRPGRANREGTDSSARWLRSALTALGLLAAAAAAVSFAAQYRLVFAAKGVAWAAALEALVPDVGAAVFAALGIALALQGRRAVRARALNVACVGLSLGMNALAAKAGWRDMAVWVMPAAVYALASDTLIGVIRASVLAQQGRADDGRTVLDAFGGLLLWALRLVLAPPSTAAGFRRWVLESCPVAPGRVAVAAPMVAALPAAPEKPGSVATSKPAPRAAGARGESKRAQLIRAYEALRGKDARFGVRAKASEVARELAADVGLEWGSARSYLYRYLDAEATR